MPTLNYDETISDVINNDENWEDEVYGLLDPDEDEVLIWKLGGMNDNDNSRTDSTCSA